MPRYRLILSAQATIGEEWIVEAESEEKAWEEFDNNLQREFVRDWIAGDEYDRTLENCERLG